MRWLRMIALALVVGALGTVLVAWASAFIIPPGPTPDHKPTSFAVYPSNAPTASDGERIGWICRRIDRATGQTMLVEFRASRIGSATHSIPSSSAPSWSITSQPAPEEFLARWNRASPKFTVFENCLVEDARGWPLPALLSVHAGSAATTTAGTAGAPNTTSNPNAPNNSGLAEGSDLDAGIRYPGPAAELQWVRVSPSLPTRIIPLGFAVDTAVIGTLAMALVWLTQQLRKATRMAEHLCVTCGQSLYGLASERCPECGQSNAVSDHRAAALGARVIAFLRGAGVRAALIALASLAMVGIGHALAPTTGEVTAVLVAAALPSLASAAALAGFAFAEHGRRGLGILSEVTSLIALALLGLVGIAMINSWRMEQPLATWMSGGGVLALSGCVVATFLFVRTFLRARLSAQWKRYITLCGVECVGVQLLALIVLEMYRSYEVEELRHALLLAPGGAMWAGLITARVWRTRRLPIPG